MLVAFTVFVIAGLLSFSKTKVGLPSLVTTISPTKVVNCCLPNAFSNLAKVNGTLSYIIA